MSGTLVNNYRHYDFVICSIIIPSKWRFNQLKKAVESFYSTANPDNFEIIVRLESDDDESVSRQHELSNFGSNLYTHVRAPKPHEAFNVFLWNDMVEYAKGSWHQYWSDDMTIHGKGWDEQLKSLPLTGVIAHPEVHQLNQSIYNKDARGPVPFLPANAFFKYGFKELPESIDACCLSFLHLRHGWKIHFLKGIRVWHRRKADRTLPIA